MGALREKITGKTAAWLLAAVIAAFTSVLAVWWGGVNQDEGWYLYAAFGCT